MKFTECFFQFPTRIYDGFDMEKARKEEELQGQSIDSFWMPGTCRIKHTDIVGWFDSFSRGKDKDDIEKDGCDITVVETLTLGPIACRWRKDKFERELDAFVEKFNAAADKEYEEALKNGKTSRVCTEGE